MKTLRFGFFALALLMPTRGMAQNNAAPELATIRGTVIRTGNGEPLSGATVTLQGVNAAFMAKYEDRGKLIHVGQNGTVSAELTIIPAIAK